MCYAIPAKVLQLVGDTATVDYGGVVKTVNVSLIDELAIGDFILIHAGFGIQKLEKDAANATLQVLRNYIEEIEKTI
jgi:hydrogenase expression/formation protein HypC